MTREGSSIPLHRPISIILISLIAITLMFTQKGSAKIEQKTIVGMWLFDEGSGDVAKDSSPNGSHATLMNGTEWVKSNFDMAVQVDGVDDYVSATVKHAPQGTEPRTVVAWVKSNDPARKGGVVAYGSPQLDQVFGFLQRGDGTWDLQLWGAPPAHDVQTGVQTDDLWHHYAVTLDGKEVIGYMDAQEMGRGTRQPKTTGATLMIGRELDGDHWFKGIIDEVAIFNVVLTQDDAKDIMEGLENLLSVCSAGKLATTWGQLKSNLE